MSVDTWSVAASMLLMVSCGAENVFSLVAEDLKETLGLYQESMEVLASVFMVGSCLGPVNGYLIHRCSQRQNCAISTVMLAAGYAYILAAMRLGGPFANVAAISLSFFLVGVGTGLAFAVGLDNIVVSCPRTIRGTLVSVVVSVASFSAFPLVFAYQLPLFRLEPKRPSRLFAFFVVLLTSAGIFATTFMRRFNQQSTEQVSLLQSVDVSDTLHSGRKGGLAEALKAAIVRPVFWLLLCNVFLLGGAGSFHLWNVGNLIHSIEGGSQAASTSSAILLSAASQGTSRLLVAASDRVAVRRGWVSAVVSLIGLGSSLIALTSLSTLSSIYVATVGFAFVCGSIWALFPLIAADAFPIGDFSKIWGLLSLGPGLGSMSFNLLAGYLYEAHSTGRDCSGTACYGAAYIATTLATGICLLSHIWIIPRTEYAGSPRMHDTTMAHS
ncbi:Nodulin-like [Plasmodiophora brassicae]